MWREEGREGWREEGREEGMEGGREGAADRASSLSQRSVACTPSEGEMM